MASVVHEITIEDFETGEPRYALGKNMSQCHVV